MTNNPRKIKRIEFAAYGLTDLSDATQLNALLEAMESIPQFAPDAVSRDERKREEYKREQAVERFAGHQLSTNNWNIYRRRAVKYAAMVKANRGPGFHIEFDAKMAVKHYPALFDWANTIADAFKPDYAVLTMLHEYDDTRPYISPLEEEIERFLYSSVSHPSAYYNVGPSGLGYQTWLSEHYLDQFGEGFLAETPNVMLEKQAWGGTKIIMGNSDSPWLLSPEELVENWRPAMEHLWKKGIFREQYIDDIGAVRVRPGANRIDARKITAW